MLELRQAVAIISATPPSTRAKGGRTVAGLSTSKKRWERLIYDVIVDREDFPRPLERAPGHPLWVFATMHFRARRGQEAENHRTVLSDALGDVLSDPPDREIAGAWIPDDKNRDWKLYADVDDEEPGGPQTTLLFVWLASVHDDAVLPSVAQPTEGAAACLPSLSASPSPADVAPARRARMSRSRNRPRSRSGS